MARFIVMNVLVGQPVARICGFLGDSDTVLVRRYREKVRIFQELAAYQEENRGVSHFSIDF